MKRSVAAPRGFTLLEILVAVIIFAMSVAVISRLVTLGMDNADYARLQAEGLLLVENRFAEIDADMDESSTDGFPGWSAETAEDPAGEFLYRITITARHTSGVTVALTRLFFDAIEAEEALSQSETAAGSSSTGTGSTSSSGSPAGGS